VKLPAPTEHVVTERGAVDVYLLPGGVVLQRVRGHATRPLADAVIRAVDVALDKHDVLALFDDWFAVTGYDSEVRKLLTEHTALHNAHMAEVHILFGSRFVAMGVAVASILVPGIRTYSERESFERVLSRTAAVGISPSSSRSAPPRAGR
jgi:hypothetical protein